MECKTCKGTGWVPSTWSPTGYPLEKCKSCDGTGHLSAQTDGAEQEGEEAPSLTGQQDKSNQR